MGKLLIVGTVAFDAIETPFGKTDKILGGAATFIGLAASQFNVKSAIVSIVGDDLPKEYLNLLSDKKIDLTGLEVVKGGKTFYWKGKYHNDLNDEEARQLTSEYSLVKAAAKIETMGPKYVVIKKGEHGALLFHKSNVFFAPALPLEEVFDPTGAGDTFAGGFAGYLTATENISFNNLKNAIIHGSNLASFCVEKFGTERMLNLKKDEVNKRLLQFKELSQFDIELQ